MFLHFWQIWIFNPAYALNLIKCCFESLILAGEDFYLVLISLKFGSLSGPYFPTIFSAYIWPGVHYTWLGVHYAWLGLPDICPGVPYIWPGLPSFWPGLPFISLRLSDIWPGLPVYGPWALCHQTLGPQTLSPKYLKSQGPRGREPEVLWILGPLPSGPWDLKYSGLKVWGPNVQGPEAQGLYGPRTFWGDVCIKKGSWFFSFGIRSAIFWHLKMTYLPWLSSEHTGAAWPVIPVGVSTCSWSIHWFLLVWVCRYLFNTLIYAHNHKCRRPYDLTELDFFDHSAPLLFLFPDSSQIKIGLLGTAHCRWVS